MAIGPVLAATLTDPDVTAEPKLGVAVPDEEDAAEVVADVVEDVAGAADVADEELGLPVEQPASNAQVKTAASGERIRFFMLIFLL